MLVGSGRLTIPNDPIISAIGASECSNKLFSTEQALTSLASQSYSHKHQKLQSTTLSNILSQVRNAGRQADLNTGASSAAGVVDPLEGMFSFKMRQSAETMKEESKPPLTMPSVQHILSKVRNAKSQSDYGKFTNTVPIAAKHI